MFSLLAGTIHLQLINKNAKLMNDFEDYQEISNSLKNDWQAARDMAKKVGSGCDRRISKINIDENSLSLL